MTEDDSPLEAYAGAYLRRSGAITGEQTYKALVLKFPHLTHEEFADLVQRLAVGGQVDVYDQPPVGSLQRFLTVWDKTAWFYFSVITSVAAALVAYTMPASSYFVFIRWGLGLLFVLFLPGYVTARAFLPTTVLFGSDRLALSVGMSLVLDMFSGLVLNYTPWGIRLIPLLLLLVAFTMGFAILALLRQYDAARLSHRRFMA